MNGDAGHIGTGHFLGTLRFFSDAFLYLKPYPWKLKFCEMESWAGFIVGRTFFLMCSSTPYFSQRGFGSNCRSHVASAVVPPGPVKPC